MSLRCEELRPDHWDMLEALFGTNGACGGCWCMWWRVPQGGRTWDEMKGERARRTFRSLVKSGKARGMIAFDGDAPVGWCAFGPRPDFPRTERSKAYAREDLDGVWSINCFFIPRPHRGKGVATKLLEEATKACRRHGARIIEAYPVPADKTMPGPFIWRGTLAMFERQGYRIVREQAPSRPLVEAPAVRPGRTARRRGSPDRRTSRR